MRKHLKLTTLLEKKLKLHNSKLFINVETGIPFIWHPRFFIDENTLFCIIEIRKQAHGK